MNETLRNALMISVLIASIFSIIAAIATFWRIYSLKKKYYKKPELDTSLFSKFPNHKVIDKELKAKAIDPIEDDEMVFINSTFIRNKYKTYSSVGDTLAYETASVEKNVSATKNDDTFDVLLIKYENDFRDKIINNYSKLSLNGMIIFMNCKKEKQSKYELDDFCARNNLKGEFIKTTNGIFLIAKTKEMSDFK